MRPVDEFLQPLFEDVQDAGAKLKKIAAALATLCAPWQGVQLAAPRLNREVTVAEQTEGEKPQFKTPMPQTPTTKILAVGTFAPGTDMSQVQRILPTAMLEELPLGKAHLMTFQLTPIGPLNPLRQLLALAPAIPH
jgi:hypothetical protein